MYRGIAFFLLAMAPRLASAQASRCDDRIILGDRVGAVRIGMPIDSLRQLCPILRDTTELDEGEAYRAIYALVANDTLRIEVAASAVGRITIRGRAFTTSDSIHVGMPLSRFLVGRHPMIGVGEGKVYLFDPHHPGNSFGLSAEAYRRVPKLTVAGLARLPRSTIIDEILVTGAPHPFPKKR